MMTGQSTTELFFIVGRGRSGTDLLRAMLNQHPLVTVSPEALFIMNLYRKYKTGSWGKKRILSFYNNLWQESRIEDWWSLDKSLLRRDMFAVGEEVSYASLCQQVYACSAATVSKLSSSHELPKEYKLGDKNPTYALFLPELLDLFPNAKFIHMVRDYRDNVLSFQNVTFDFNNPVILAERWRIYNATILEYSRRYPERFYTLRFEDLLASTEQYLDKICSFLKIDFNRKMLEYHNNQGDVRVWQSNIATPLKPGRVFAWRKKMDTCTIQVVENICGALGRELGYERSRENGSNKRFSGIVGVGIARVATWFERKIFFIPLWLRTLVLTVYRILSRTKTPRALSPGLKD